MRRRAPSSLSAGWLEPVPVHPIRRMNLTSTHEDSPGSGRGPSLFCFAACNSSRGSKAGGNPLGGRDCTGNPYSPNLPKSGRLFFAAKLRDRPQLAQGLDRGLHVGFLHTDSLRQLLGTFISIHIVKLESLRTNVLPFHTIRAIEREPRPAAVKPIL